MSDTRISLFIAFAFAFLAITMSAASTWNTFVWTTLAKPKCDRALFRRVRTHKPIRIVELGIDIVRAQRVIALAQRYAEEQVQYCGIDLFEARTAGPRLKLKNIHNQLTKTGAKVRLVPGELAHAIARTANILPNTDLLIVAGEHSQDALKSIFSFLPRMLHSETSIARYTEAADGMRLRWMKPDSFVTPSRRAA